MLEVVAFSFHPLEDLMRIAFAIAHLTMLTLLLATMPALADGDMDRKIEVNKFIEMSEFTPQPSSPTTVGEIEPNDDCTMPDPANPFDSLINAAINVGGDEDWFAFDGTAGELVTIGTDAYYEDPADTELYLYYAPDCVSDIAYNDDGGPGQFSRIRSFPLPADGTYYIRVKSWYTGTGTGTYLLSATSEPYSPPSEPPANDLCENAEVVACGMAVQGTTVLGTSEFEDDLRDCVPFGAEGPDVFYEVVVPASYQMTAVLDPTTLWDCALWIVTDCTDENTCVAGVDSGFASDLEFLSWTNESGVPVTLYLVVDSYSAGAFGRFNLEVSCDVVVVPSPEVAAERSSWGSVKARF